MSHYEEVFVYCKQILNHEIMSGRYCYLAIKRFKNDLEKQKSPSWKFEFIPSLADEVIDFAESLIIPDMVGDDRHLKLLPWMKFIYYNLFGWVYKEDNTRRRFRDGYVEVARKNSKTTSLLFPIILYDFLTTNAAEAYFVNADLPQSQKSYKELKAIIAEDDSLKKVTDSTTTVITLKNSRITFFCDGTKATDGYRNSCTIIDEYHSYTSDDIITAFRYGGRARKNCLVLKITSAGNNPSGPCKAENESCQKMLNGILTNESYFGLIYAYDEKDDWKDPSLFIKANPSLGASFCSQEILESDLDDALLKPHHQPDFKSKTCGIWTTGKSGWVDLQTFTAEQPDSIDFARFKNKICCGAIDLSSTTDFTAYSRAFLDSDDYYMKHDFYIPESTLAERYAKENINILEWVEKGIVTAIPGAVIDDDFLLSDIKRDIEAGFNLTYIYYDPWQSSNIIKRIEEEFPDIILVPYAQSLKNLSAPTKEYEKLIIQHHIKDPNPVIKWMLGNVEIKPDTNNNYKPMKDSKASNKRIDGIVTSIMARRALADFLQSDETSKKTTADFAELLKSF